jgi:hypothetical protein
MSVRSIKVRAQAQVFNNNLTQAFALEANGSPWQAQWRYRYCYGVFKALRKQGGHRKTGVAMA